MPRPLAGSPDLTTSAADAILQSQQPEVEAEVEAEAESVELVKVQRAVPARSEAKEPTERTDDPVRMYLREMGSVELSRTRDRTLHPDCGVASRRRSAPTDAHGLRRHFHGSLDAAWGDLTSACAE